METTYRVSRIIANELNNDRYAKVLKSELNKCEELGSVDITYNKCTIEEDWILELEDKLRYVERAIDEDRHELKKEGNVVRIDQVRKVSVDSIRHLAQHSNYITDPDDKMTDIVPEKLYVSENYDNHLLYENRFLYTILMYAKDFVETRYSAILRGISDVEKGLDINCNLKSESRNINLDLNYSEKCENDDWIVDKATKRLIDRINTVLETIVVLLDRPLMKMASDMSMLKLPITATNIIKNDIHFQEAYKLFDFLVSYSKKGYAIEQNYKESKEISPAGREDVVSIISLLRMLTEIEAGERRIQMEKALLESKVKNLPAEEINLIDEMRRLFDAEVQKNDEEWAQKLHDLELAKNGEIDAIRAKFDDFTDDAHMEAESFKRLTEEKKAFDEYYKKRWSMIKKKVRKEYFWNRLKNK